MAKTNQIKKLVNGEIADADDVNQIVENAGAEGGSIPYSDANQQRSTLGNENLGSANYPWGDIFVNKEAYLRELITTSASISASVKFDNLRKIIYMKDLFTTTTNQWAGHAGQFLKVRSTEDGIEPSAPTDSRMFTVSGTFDVPLGITKVYLTMIGGGGGGTGSLTGGSSSGGGGGAGAYKINHPFAVTPGGTYTVTVGAGGAGGAVNNNGGTGGATSFDSVSVAGGQGGQGADGGVGAGTGFNASASVSTASVAGGGQTSIGGNGAARNGAEGGGGGGSPFGSGASGGTSGNGYDGIVGTANTGVGGGGGAGGKPSVNAIGGNGGSGFVLVMY